MSKCHSELLQLYNNTEVIYLRTSPSPSSLNLVSPIPSSNQLSLPTILIPQAGKDRIWHIARTIWNTCSSSMVCRAFLLAFRILGKIIITKGDTDWLKHGTPHCNVRRDFYDTDIGVKRVKEVVVVEPESAAAEEANCASY